MAKEIVEMKPQQLLLCILCVVHGCSSARILSIVPTPSFSHQLPLRLIMNALHERGHDITVITTDPLRVSLNIRQLIASLGP